MVIKGMLLSFLSKYILFVPIRLTISINLRNKYHPPISWALVNNWLPVYIHISHLKCLINLYVRGQDHQFIREPRGQFSWMLRAVLNTYKSNRFVSISSLCRTTHQMYSVMKKLLEWTRILWKDIRHLKEFIWQWKFHMLVNDHCI